MLTTALLLVAASAAAGIGVWNLAVVDRFDGLTVGVNDKIATVRGEIDEFNAD